MLVMKTLKKLRLSNVNQYDILSIQEQKNILGGYDGYNVVCYIYNASNEAVAMGYCPSSNYASCCDSGAVKFDSSGGCVCSFV
jgi:hypothetical protein